MRIADHIAAHMRSEGINSLCWGDPILVDAMPGSGDHPLDAMQKGLAALERAPDLFEKHRIHAHDRSGKPRVVRGFRLKETSDNSAKGNSR